MNNNRSLPSFNLTGQVALVTGASKGMGRSIAALFAQAGARVVVSSRNQAACARVAGEISTEEGQCAGIASDIADPESLKALVAAAETTVGRPDILVCNAAESPGLTSLDQVDAAAFQQAMMANVGNNLLLVNLVAPAMAAKGGGSIILMSSIAGGRGRTNMGLYSITKAAVNQLVRTLAVEWGPRHVRTNAIAPATVRTDFSRALWEDPATLARATSRVPLGRIGEADDVAGLALLLASPAGAFINGQTIGVDGGLSIAA